MTDAGMMRLFVYNNVWMSLQFHFSTFKSHYKRPFLERSTCASLALCRVTYCTGYWPKMCDPTVPDHFHCDFFFYVLVLDLCLPASLSRLPAGLIELGLLMCDPIKLPQVATPAAIKVKPVCFTQGGFNVTSILPCLFFFLCPLFELLVAFKML